MVGETMERESFATLADVLERILDKGVVINADITVSVVGVELLGIKIRAAVASFETAARYGLEFPSGVNLAAPAWKQLLEEEARAQGGERLPAGALFKSNGSARTAAALPR